jgi:hypothetical protein
MDGKLMSAPFDKIGARAKAFVVPTLDADRLVRLDVRTDARGPFYEILVLPHVTLRAVDVRPDMRHLLLLAVDHSRVGGGGEKHKFLCGHDERHWFVAGVPAERGVADVRGAMESLKPKGVQWLQDRLNVKYAERIERRTAAYIRQGEWFFIRPNRTTGTFNPRGLLVRCNEPLSRGAGSKPHVAQLACRHGGEVVHVSARYPRGLTVAEYEKLIRSSPHLKRERWWTARRNPDAFVRGAVRHPDHATIVLDDWHQVLMNEEGKSPAMRHIAFVD